jgi:hypothetical protein
MPYDPRTGQRQPYPGEPGYQGPGGGGGGQAYNPAGGVGGPNLRRPSIGGPPVGTQQGRGPQQAQGPQAGLRRRRPMGGGGPGRVAPPQMAMNRPAQVGSPIAGLGDFGALGAVPGVGTPGAVNPGSLLNIPGTRKRGGLA